MGIFPRITAKAAHAAMEHLSSNTREACHRFMLEQPVITQAMRTICKSDEEFLARVSSMHFLYVALQKQIDLGNDAIDSRRR